MCLLWVPFNFRGWYVGQNVRYRDCGMEEGAIISILSRRLTARSQNKQI